jgi:hypothetical protein
MKTLKNSGGCITEAEVSPCAFKKDENEFTQTTYTRNAQGEDNKEKYQRLTVSKSGVGVIFELYKNGKRSTELSMELGKTELEMLLKYIDSIKADIRDYSGEYEIKEL